MTYQEIADMLASLKQNGLDVTYYSYPEEEAPPLPYCVYYYPSSDNFSADNTVYSHITALNIELYTENKSLAEEAKVEAMLSNYGIFWNKSESYITSEKMYEVLYEMEVMING